MDYTKLGKSIIETYQQQKKIKLSNAAWGLYTIILCQDKSSVSIYDLAEISCKDRRAIGKIDPILKELVSAGLITFDQCLPRINLADKT